MKRALSVLFAATMVLSMPVAGAGEPEYLTHGMAQAGPTEVYLRYAKVMHVAGPPEANFPYSPQQAAQLRESAAGMPPQQAAQAPAFLKSLVPRQPQVVGETVAGDTATLQVRGLLPNRLSGAMEPNHGTVTLLRRGGEWKISDQSFENDR